MSVLVQSATLTISTSASGSRVIDLRLSSWSGRAKGLAPRMTVFRDLSLTSEDIDSIYRILRTRNGSLPPSDEWRTPDMATEFLEASDEPTRTTRSTTSPRDSDSR